MVSRANDFEDNMLLVAVREAWVDSSSRVNRALASLEFRKDCSHGQPSSLFLSQGPIGGCSGSSLLKQRFLQFYGQGYKPRASQSQKRNQRFEAEKEEWVPSRSAYASFTPSKKLAICRAKSLASMMEWIVKSVSLVGGGVGALAADKDICVAVGC
jgi:hypothetical protein